MLGVRRGVRKVVHPLNNTSVLCVCVCEGGMGVGNKGTSQISSKGYNRMLCIIARSVFISLFIDDGKTIFYTYFRIYFKLEEFIIFFTQIQFLIHSFTIIKLQFSINYNE